MRGQSPPFRTLTISAPSCSAPCKAFSLNSLPFNGTAAAHICGNQGTATPPPRPARLPRPWSPCPKVSPSPLSQKYSCLCPLHLLFSGLCLHRGKELRSFPSGQPVLNFSLQNVSEEWGWRAGGREDLLGPNPSSVSNLLWGLGKVTSPLWRWGFLNCRMGR